MPLRALALATLIAAWSNSRTATVRGLTLPPLPLTGAVERTVSPALSAAAESGRTVQWRGQLAGHAASIALHILPIDRADCSEPEHLVQLHRTSGWYPRGFHCSRFPVDPWHPRLTSHLESQAWWAALDEGTTWRGRSGWSDSAGFCQGALRPRDSGQPGQIFVLGGLLAEGGFVLEVTCRPPPGPEVTAQILAFLRGVRWQGPRVDPRWSDSELRERIAAAVPKELQPRMRPPLRTEHYLILGTASFGPAFGRQAEARYRRIRAEFPFEERPGRRLLPIFLFRDRNEYELFCQHHGVCKTTRGFAWQDFYAACYEAPGDRVHMHEAVHQLFRNRLFLSGGGTWLQEGVAEYLASTPVERAAQARSLDRNRVRQASDLFGFGLRHYGFDFYPAVGLWIAFLRESKATAPRFQAILRAAACTPSACSTEAVQDLLWEVGRVSLSDLDQDWRAWCDQRCRPLARPRAVAR